ncbi:MULTISPECIES: DUF5954 family protein [unclassified Streptomyces]|uniref:DUF5954 family protein n=1 Tax=unclassified Streptomyces TaxID=2593676 RepID=UPI00344BF9EA
MKVNGDAQEEVTGREWPRPTAPPSPVAAGLSAPADVETWKARKAYPSTLFAGGPVFGVARELPEGGWTLRPGFAGLAPQDARDALGAHFRARAERCAADGDETGRAQYTEAAERLDWERLDELTVAGARYRVVRAERFIRMGPDGPEPPRGTDPDRTDPAQPPLDPAADLTIASGGEAGLSPGVLRVELLTALRKNGTVPRDVREDSRAAARTHPGGVLLPATFMAAEREGGRWRPQSTGTAATPRDARDGLAVQLRVMVPWQHELTDEEHEFYKRAADHLDTDQVDELDVAGRHFRIIRVERLIRIGPDGPEGPRPSDVDPVPPAMVQERQLREQGPVQDEEDGDAEASTRKFMALLDEERRRREHLRERP